MSAKRSKSEQAPTEAQLRGLRRGIVVDVDLRDGIGSEQRKIRPALIVSSDTYNEKLDTLIVIAITGLENKDRALHPHEVEIRKGDGGLDQRSAAQTIQLHTIDRYKRVKAIRKKVGGDVLNMVNLKLWQTLGGV